MDKFNRTETVIVHFMMLVLFFLLNTQAKAADTQVSGFGTLGAAWFSNPHADFQYNQITKGPGRSQPFDLGLDSKLGLQLDHRWNDRFSLAIQAISFHTAEDNFAPDLSLAFVRIQLTPALMVRIGRFQNPVFLYSDSRHVNFDQFGVRPAKNLYGISPYFQMDGVEFDYKSLIGNWGSEWQFGTGSTDFSTSIGHINFQESHLKLTLDKFPWTLATSLSLFHTTLHSQLLNDALTGISYFESSSQLSNALTLSHKDMNQITVSFRYDDQNWLVLSEYGKLNTASFVGISEGAYITLGKYLKNNLIYLTYSQRWSETAEFQATTPSSQFIVNYLIWSGNYSNQAWTLGIRHELMENMRLKIQADLITPKANTVGPYVNQDTYYNNINPNTDLLIKCFT